MAQETSSSSRFLTSLETLFQRFSLPLLLAACACGLLLSSRGDETMIRDLLPQKVLVTVILSCAFFWFVSARLYAEARKTNAFQALLVAAVLFLVFVWPLGRAHFLFGGPAFAGLGFFLTPFCAPTLPGPQKKVFQEALLRHTGWAILAALALGLLLSGLLHGVSRLFEFEFYKYFFLDLWIVLLSFVMPTLALCGVPDPLQEAAPHAPSRKVALFLAYGVWPLFLLHALLLIAFFVKGLPKYPVWEVPILWHSTFLLGLGFFLTSLATPARAEVAPVLSLFAKGFGALSPLLLGMLATGLVAEVQGEGVKEWSFAVGLVFLWGLILTGVLWAGKELPLVPVAAALLLLGSLIVEPLSTWNQEARFYALLKEGGMLVDGRLQKPKKPFPQKEKLRWLVGYLCRTGKTKALCTLIDCSPQKPQLGSPPPLLLGLVFRKLGIHY